MRTPLLIQYLPGLVPLPDLSGLLPFEEGDRDSSVEKGLKGGVRETLSSRSVEVLSAVAIELLCSLRVVLGLKRTCSGGRRYRGIDEFV